MPNVIELQKSGDGKESLTGDSTADGIYLIREAPIDPLDQRIYIESQLSGSLMGLAGTEYTIETLAPDLVLIKVPYKEQQPQKSDKDRPPGSRKITFEVGGGTINAKTSLETVGSYFDPSIFTAPDTNNTVNVDENGPQGADIYVPSFNFEIAHWIPKTDLTPTYIIALYNLTSRYNNAAWQPTDGRITLPNFAAGEVLFLGTSGSERSEDDYELRYRFAAEPNVSGRTIGNMTGISKKGWDYLWARYSPKKDGSSVVKIPLYAKVERMYEPGDFSIFD